MYTIKKIMFFFFIIQNFAFLKAADSSPFPPGVLGTSCFDYFKESLPPKSRGVYKIFAPDNSVKYIGSSHDIDKRLYDHQKKGLLKPGDMVLAIIFENDVRQRKIFSYEKSLIGKFTPPLNKHAGAPGRSWRSEQMLKLQTFSDHNWHLLHPEAQKIVSNMLKGKILCDDHKMAKSLLRVMNLFL